jgi:flagellar motor protein MotB
MRIEKTIGMLLGLSLLFSACLVPSNKFDKLKTDHTELQEKYDLETSKNKSLQDYIDRILEGNTVIHYPRIISASLSQKAYQYQYESPERIYSPRIINATNEKWFSTDIFSEVKMRRKETSLVFEVETEILFDKGRASLSPGDEIELSKLVDWLKDEQASYEREYIVRIEGHAGKNERWEHPQWKDPWTLSVMRAVSVVNFLEEAGLAPEQLIASGRGQAFVQQADSVAEASGSNRRVEILLSLVEKPK